MRMNKNYPGLQEALGTGNRTGHRTLLAFKKE